MSSRTIGLEMIQFDVFRHAHESDNDQGQSQESKSERNIKFFFL